MAMPVPPVSVATSAGPSGATADGSMRDMGYMSVGDFYATGSRVRKSEGLGWVELAVIGAVGLIALKVWRS